MAGIEPAPQGWKPCSLPLRHTRASTTFRTPLEGSNAMAVHAHDIALLDFSEEPPQADSTGHSRHESDFGPCFPVIEFGDVPGEGPGAVRTGGRAKRTQDVCVDPPLIAKLRPASFALGSGRQEIRDRRTARALQERRERANPMAVGADDVTLCDLVEDLLMRSEQRRSRNVEALFSWVSMIKSPWRTAERQLRSLRMQHGADLAANQAWPVADALPARAPSRDSARSRRRCIGGAYGQRWASV